MTMIEVYEHRAGEPTGIAEKKPMICMIEMPASGPPHRGEFVLFPGTNVGDAESLGVYFRVLNCFSFWLSSERDTSPNADLRFKKHWIVVERVPDAEL